MAVYYAFEKNYDHRVSESVLVAYKAGTSMLVPNAHAWGAYALGCGKKPVARSERGVQRKRAGETEGSVSQDVGRDEGAGEGGAGEERATVDGDAEALRP